MYELVAMAVCEANDDIVAVYRETDINREDLFPEGRFFIGAIGGYPPHSTDMLSILNDWVAIDGTRSYNSALRIMTESAKSEM